ncbi:hypothetical protein MmiAt1_14450 [Methanimicrococcus sp. At1]|uniref:Phosphatidate cytidylyltransferase n=1 Tax=Methanimicrococcus hacksteinii TaxID=3028293 RepID=A0ABU3VR15_9EURY|nr:SEC59/DGK1/VTE5 family protein [Methanimicrococcus sp. At1]MDV0445845.1 hypothetical protein [Methanimicrococcus sp. At1]
MSDDLSFSEKYRNELARKFLHMCSFIIVIFIYFADKKTACIVIGALFALLFIGNTILLSSGFRVVNDIKVKYFSFLLRDDEKYGYISSNWFLLGCFFSVLLFPKYIAMLGITVLIFGDAFAALIGMRFGKHKFKNGKSLEGTLGFIFVSYLFLAGFAFFLPDIGSAFIAAALISIPFVAVAEIYSKQIKIDDNLVIPLVFGALMLLFMKIFEVLGLFL